MRVLAHDLNAAGVMLGALRHELRHNRKTDARLAFWLAARRAGAVKIIHCL
jgi:hypothetical protein